MNTKRTLFYIKIIMLLLLLNSGNSYFAQDHSFSPASEKYGTGSNFLLNFYQNYISPIKGGNYCPMHPSCSQYSKLSFQKLPVYLAYVKTFDRIMRCGHELGNYSLININGYFRWYDPVLSDDEQDHLLDLNPSNEEFATDSSVSKFSGLDNKFADYLFDQKDYSRASTEYLRLRFYENDAFRKKLYLYKSGLCFFNSGRYDDFISFAEKNRSEFLNLPELKADLEFDIAKSYFEQKSYNKAIVAFDEAVMNNSEKLKDEIYYYRGLSYARLFFWNEAAKNMKKVNDLSEKSVIARKFRKAMPEAENLPSLSPFLAGFASAVLPGSGYLYAHRPGTAITSFVINSLFAWTVYSAIKKENYGLASITAFFGSGWYLGNIYGSSQAVRDYNTNVRNEFIDKLLDENIH